jgi:hypothetical protein
LQLYANSYKQYRVKLNLRKLYGSHEMRNALQFLLEDQKGRDHLHDLGVDGRQYEMSLKSNRVGECGLNSS